MLDPTEAQVRVLGHRRGTLLVTGPPGSGKTAVLRERFARLVEDGVDPEQVALFTLSRRAARETKDHLIRRLGRSLPGLPVFTVHAYAFRTLVGKHFAALDYEEPPRVLSAPEQYAAVREMLAIERREDWPRFGHLLSVPTFARQVADFALRCQERLLDPDALEELVERSGRHEYREVAAFYRRYLDALSEAGEIDFGGLLFQTATLLGREIPEDDRFRHVLVDDYQDATLAGEAIVRALGVVAESTVVAADPAAHVFSYRGGSLEPFLRLAAQLPPERRVELEESHRLGPRAHALAPLADPALPPAVPAHGLEARLVAHPGEEVEAVAHELLRLRVDEDVPWAEMAVVLRRYGPYLTALRHALSRHDIPYVVVAEEAALVTEPAVRQVIDLLRYVFRPDRREELLEPLLTSPVGGLDPHALRRLRRVARTRDRPLRELVEDGELDDLPPDLRFAVEAFRALLRELPDLAGTEGPDGVFFRLWARLPHFRGLVAAPDAAHRRDLDALAAFANTLGRFAERRPDSGVEDYLEALDAAEFGPDPWIRPEERHPDAVRVISAHLAQGLEFEAVMVVGCLEGEFPSLARGDPLVSLDPLVRPRTPPERIGDRLAEERSLFRLAVSRARRKTVLFASRSTGSRNPRTPSRFAARLGLPWTTLDGEPGPATSLRSMEAALRRRLADRSEETARRLAATAALSRAGSRPSTWWGGREWTDPGLPLYEGDITTSYSRLSTLENCGLQYLYEVELGLDPTQTFQMWLGSVVHRVIERVHGGEVEASEEAVLEALDREWRSDVFPNRAVEHRRYVDAKDMLLRWLRSEPHDPVRSEVKFQFPIDGGVVRGKIDAIFRMNTGRLRIVDYKTGRAPPTKEEAQQDLQLAAYYLAALRDPELSALGEPGYLQLAYLAVERAAEGFLRRDVAPNKIQDYEGWAEGRILDLLSLVRQEAFAPNPEADCRFCPFKTICPRWLPGRQAPVAGAGVEASG